MDYSQTPLWMQDDLVKDIPREKLEFLSTLFAKGHGKSQKEMMVRQSRSISLLPHRKCRLPSQPSKNTAPKQSCSRFRTF